MTLPYGDLAVIWLLCGLLGAGFYVAVGKEMTIGLSRRRRRNVSAALFVFAVLFGPLAIAASLVEMCRMRKWYDWSLW